MTHVAIPPTRLHTDILKTVLTFFSGDADFDGAAIRERGFDKDTDMVLPCLIIKDLSSGGQVLARNSGYYGVTSAPDNPGADLTLGNDDDYPQLGRLMGYRLELLLQIDIVARTIAERNRLRQLVEAKLKGTGASSSDAFAALGMPVQVSIRVLDFPSPETTKAQAVATDVYLKSRFWRDVEGVEVPTFDPELHQFSISINCWVDNIQAYNIPQIASITQPVTIED